MNRISLFSYVRVLAMVIVVASTQFSAGAMAGSNAITVQVSDLDGSSLQRERFSALTARAQTSGSIRVLVEVDVENGGLEPQAIGPQAADRKTRIASAQRRVVSILKSKTAAERSHRFSSIPFVAMTVTAEDLAALAAEPLVRTISLDTVRQRHLSQSVPLIGANQGHGVLLSGTGQAVVVIDDGIHTAHPFLQGKVVDEACFVSRMENSILGDCPNGFARMTGAGSGVPNCPDCTHGTHVAGIVAGGSGSFSGVAPGAFLISARALGEQGGLDSDILAALEWAYSLRHRYSIAAVNMSLGSEEDYGSVHCDLELPSYKAMFDNLWAAGIAPVVSTGNAGERGKIAAPACVSSAVAVGATDKLDVVAGYSNHAVIVDLMAPGSSVNSSTVQDGGYVFESWNGTSMAAPHVAGAWAVFKQANPHLPPGDALARFVQTGKLVSASVNSSQVAKSRVDLAGALGSAIDRSADAAGRRILPAAGLTAAGQPTASAAVFALGVGTVGSVGTGGYFPASVPLGVSGTVAVDPSSVGMTGALHAVAYYVDTSGAFGWFMLTSGGWVPWSTDLQSLSSIEPLRPLNANESFDLARELIGLPGTFAIYVGYSVGGMLHYTANPLTFTVHP